MLPSWISKITGLPIYCHAGTSKNNDLLETKWLRSAEQTTGESDVESVLSIDSGLGTLEAQAHEDFTDLQADANLQSASIEFQNQVKTIHQILADIHLDDETAVPRDIRVRIREHARVIAYIFGDGKSQNLGVLLPTWRSVPRLWHCPKAPGTFYSQKPLIKAH
jgi:hypothetical protein